MTIGVVIADDHRLVREGLRALLQDDAADFEVLGEACDGLAALRVARELRPDVLVADVSMPGLNGIELVRQLREELPTARVLSLSVHDEERLVLAMIEAGAAGYVLKDASFDELRTAIREVMAGRVYLSPSLLGIFVSQFRSRGKGSAALPAGEGLTPRERELVQLFSEGFSTAEIAERLHVSTKTVATHRENIMGKLQIDGIAELTRYALREGISSLETPCRRRRV
jgi:DNA-binding NarL/FixJ family response regulator